MKTVSFFIKGVDFFVNTLSAIVYLPNGVSLITSIGTLTQFVDEVMEGSRSINDAQYLEDSSKSGVIDELIETLQLNNITFEVTTDDEVIRVCNQRVSYKDKRKKYSKWKIRDEV